MLLRHHFPLPNLFHAFILVPSFAFCSTHFKVFSRYQNNGHKGLFFFAHQVNGITSRTRAVFDLFDHNNLSAWLVQKIHFST